MLPAEPPKCLECKHLLDEKGFPCAAFPDGIPKDIIMGRDHTKPIKGDHGIQFEAKDPD